MTEESQYLLEMARRVIAPYTKLPEARAAMVTGSVAEGESDRYSDIDMTVYYENLPDDAELDAIKATNGGGERNWIIGDRAEGAFAESYHVNGVEVQIGHAAIEAWERDMAQILVELDAATPLHKALSGTLDCIPLYGDDLIHKWKDAAADYPDALAKAMVEAHLKFFPLWGLQGRLLSRDSLLWCQDSLVEAAQNILGVLAGLNRLYYSTFQFKRMRRFVGRMRIAPQDLVSRIESLFTLESQQAAVLLESLIQETVDLVKLHMPEVDTTAAAKRLGWRQQPWTPVL